MTCQSPDVVGYKLDDAMRRLQGSSAVIVVETVSGKKGVPGADSHRVIRQREQDGKLLLALSAFICSIPGWDSCIEQISQGDME